MYEDADAAPPALLCVFFDDSSLADSSSLDWNVSCFRLKLLLASCLTTPLPKLLPLLVTMLMSLLLLMTESLVLLMALLGVTGCFSGSALKASCFSWGW